MSIVPNQLEIVGLVHSHPLRLVGLRSGWSCSSAARVGQDTSLLRCCAKLAIINFLALGLLLWRVCRPHLLLGGSLGIVTLLNRPIEDVVVLKALADEQVTEQLAQVRIVGLVIESQRPAVVEVDGELVGETAAQILGRGRHLFLHDAVVLLLFGGGLESLPRQRASQEVHEHVTQRLHVVPTRLFWRA